MNSALFLTGPIITRAPSGLIWRFCSGRFPPCYRVGGHFDRPPHVRMAPTRRQLMISGPAEFPLRVVYLTQSPGDFALDVPAYALAHTLRQQGDACLVGVGKLPLPSLTVAKADRYGIEQVYLPLETRFAGWHPLLRRFQPHIIHFGPDIPTAMSHKLIKTLHLARRATVILEDPVHPSHLTPQDNAMWHP